MNNVSPPSETITFYFNGEELTAIIGQTVGASILSSGQRALRETRFKNKPRGMFCGMGVCFDCLVVINGTPNLRACLEEVKEGMQVNTQIGSGQFPGGDVS